MNFKLLLIIFGLIRRSKDMYEEIRRCDVVLFEGILVFYHKEIRDLFNMKLFVDSDADTRLSRRGIFTNPFSLLTALGKFNRN